MNAFLQFLFLYLGGFNVYTKTYTRCAKRHHQRQTLHFHHFDSNIADLIDNGYLILFHFILVFHNQSIRARAFLNTKIINADNNCSNMEPSTQIILGKENIPRNI
jgi:hypothetical protein